MLDWIVDCGYTPHLIVDATPEVVRVPRQFVKEGRIVLNISASATQAFQIGAAAVEFSARFGGISHSIRVPVEHVLGIYARETGQGMVFTEEPGSLPAEAAATAGPETEPPEPPAPAPDRPKRPTLTVVK
jgi:stringent starvation protein B